MQTNTIEKHILDINLGNHRKQYQQYFIICVLGCFSIAIMSGCGNGGKVSNEAASGAYSTGQYRNLFAELGYSQDEINQKVNNTFEQMFYGDPANEALYFPAGSNENGLLAYILDVNNNDVRSEGMSYGMMIAVQLDKKVEFDAIWNWSKTYMYHDDPKHPAYCYFAWSNKIDGTAIDEMPAPDGEEYYAMSLYFASARWGNGKGIYNYKAEADKLLTDMLHREAITGPTKSGTLTGLNLFDLDRRLVRFTPDKANANRTDPSYHLPAFYELWAMWGPEPDRKFWAEAAEASRDFMQKATHPITGLSSDYANFDGTAWASPWNPSSEYFQYDSWRNAMNLGCDWSWWGKDERIPILCDRLQAFFETQGIETYGNRYTQEGKQIGNDHNIGIVAMNAVAGLAATDARAKKFTQELWDAEIPTGKYRYYDGMLYMLGTLQSSGNFRIWSPGE